MILCREVMEADEVLDEMRRKIRKEVSKGSELSEVREHYVA